MFFLFATVEIGQESPAVADKPARRESMPKIALIWRENKPSRGTPTNVNEIYTSMKSTFNGIQFCRWQYGYISIHLAGACQICEILWNSTKIRT